MQKINAKLGIQQIKRCRLLHNHQLILIHKPCAQRIYVWWMVLDFCGTIQWILLDLCQVKSNYQETKEEESHICTWSSKHLLGQWKYVFVILLVRTNSEPTARTSLSWLGSLKCGQISQQIWRRYMHYKEDFIPSWFLTFIEGKTTLLII